jgi:hypothetical protein
MSNDPDSPPERKLSTAEIRQADRAAALRANLMRRKEQARGQIKAKSGQSQGEPQPKTPADA